VSLGLVTNGCHGCGWPGQSFFQLCNDGIIQETNALPGTANNDDSNDCSSETCTMQQ